jgi:hypothetical protein
VRHLNQMLNQRPETKRGKNHTTNAQATGGSQLAACASAAPVLGQCQHPTNNAITQFKQKCARSGSAPCQPAHTTQTPCSCRQTSCGRNLPPEKLQC